jgi:hypothetical protein
MNGQVDKKRKVIIDGNEIRLQTRRITINTEPPIIAGKVKFKDVWYIFDLDTGRVISQADNWTDCLNWVKDVIKVNTNKNIN